MANYESVTVNGKRHSKHRFVMEQHLNRKLLSNEIVHHKNWDRCNNELNNLEVMDKKEHNRLSGRTNLTGAKLLKQDVLIIRSMLNDGIRHFIIALAFGVNRRTITAINIGTIWSWV